VNTYQRVRPVTVPNLWLTVFSSALCAILLGGVLLALGFRAYIHWSVQDTVRKLDAELRGPKR
jgi:hypothetical protein